MKFDQYHPLINLLYFIFIFYMGIHFEHPIYVAVTFLSSFVYNIGLRGKKGLYINIGIMILLSIYYIYFVSFHHFGITPIAQTIVDNSFTLESIVYGGIKYLILCASCMWFSCFLYVFSSDKVMYIFGKVIPKLSLFITIFLRMFTKLKATSKKVLQAQEGIGKGIKHGNIYTRLIHFKRMVSIVLVWFFDDCIQSSKSMCSRGYTLKNRTQFSIYRFDNRDRIFVVYVTSLITVQCIALLLDQVSISYNPIIIWNKITIVSYLFYFGYLLFTLLPLLLQWKNNIKFSRLKFKKMYI